MGDPSADRTAAYVTIEALNSWAIFAREYYLSCALYRARTIQGALSGPSQAYGNERDALVAAIGILKPHLFSTVSSAPVVEVRSEPPWHEVNTLIKLASTLAFSNFAQVASAFSYPTNFFRHSPPIRNFFAHRNKGTAEKVIRVIAAAPYYSTERVAYRFLGNLMVGRPQTVMAEWLDDLRLVSYELCL